MYDIINNQICQMQNSYQDNVIKIHSTLILKADTD